MRHPRRTIPHQPLQHMWERQKEIARLLVAGKTQKEIGDMLKISQTRMSIICNSPIFKDHVDELSRRRDIEAVDVQETIERASQDAVQFLHRVLRGEVDQASTNTKVKVAQDFLDRGGYGKTSIQRNENVNITLNASKIEELKQRRKDMLSAIETPLISAAAQ